MNIPIELYRGYQIVFNTNDETFTYDIDESRAKKSFGACKTAIDVFIKENSEFKPFDVEYDSYGVIKKFKVIAKRKDDCFVLENEKGERSQLSKYSEGDYYTPNESNYPKYEEINVLREKRNAIDKQIDAINKTLIKVTIKDLRKNL